MFLTLNIEFGDLTPIPRRNVWQVADLNSSSWLLPSNEGGTNEGSIGGSDRCGLGLRLLHS